MAQAKLIYATRVITLLFGSRSEMPKQAGNNRRTTIPIPYRLPRPRRWVVARVVVLIVVVLVLRELTRRRRSRLQHRQPGEGITRKSGGGVKGGNNNETVAARRQSAPLLGGMVLHTAYSRTNATTR